MHITLYKSNLCPRCYIAKKHILSLINQDSEISFEEIDIITSPLIAWKDGVRMIPAIKIDNDILSGAILTRAQLAEFINQKKTN